MFSCPLIGLNFVHSINGRILWDESEMTPKKYPVNYWETYPKYIEEIFWQIFSWIGKEKYINLV